MARQHREQSLGNRGCQGLATTHVSPSLLIIAILLNEAGPSPPDNEYDSVMAWPRESLSVPAVPAPELSPLRFLRDFPTPLVVHDLAVLRTRAAHVRRFLPEDATLLYSLKAIPLPPVVAALQHAGCGSEV